MAATDARAIPFKNAAYRVTFPILDADGDLVTGATGLDSEVSLDAGTFADCTNEATEIATASGLYYLDLTAAEMNADTVAVIVKTSSTGAKTTVLTLYPQEDGDLKANVTQAAGTAWGSGAITAASIADGAIDAATFAADVWTRLGIVTYGTAQAATGTTIQLASASAFADDELLGAVVVITGGSTGVGQSRMITDYVSSTDTATVDAWTTTPTGTITYVVFAAAPASVTSLPAVNVTQISGDATAADNLEAAADGTGYNLGGGSVVAASVTGNVGGNVTGSVGSVATGGITAASIATGAIDADALAADAVTEIWAGSTAPAVGAIADAVWDEAMGGHVGAGSAGLYFAQTLADTNELQTDWTNGGRLDLILDATATSTAVADVPTVAEFEARTLPAADYVVVSDTLAAVTTVGSVSGSVGSLAAQAKADVNAEVLDVLVTDTFAEPATVPAATSSLKDKLVWLFTLGRNKITQTATTQTLRNDADAADVATAAVSDDTTTFTRGEWT